MPTLRLRPASALLLLALLMATLSGCGSSPAPPAAQAPGRAPSPTPRPTRVRPTASPRATRQPPTLPPAASATPAADESLRLALGRTINLAAYRMVFSWQVTSTLVRGQPEQVINTDYRGDINRGDSALRVTTGKTSSETIIKDGVTYVRGPLPLPGADKPVWYDLGSSSFGGGRSAFAQPRFITALTKRVELADLRPDGSLDYDGQRCDRYTGGLRPALSVFDGLGVPTSPEGQAQEATPVVERMQGQGFTFDQASAAEVLVCADGYVHLLRSNVRGTSPDSGGTPLEMSVLFSISEPNGDIAIAAPTGAVKYDLNTTGLSASVFNGGNVRETPSLGGKVLDQINAGETVRLLGKTADGRWYKLSNPRNITGWVSATLLTIDAQTAAKVPVTQ